MSVATGSADVQWVKIRAGQRFSRSPVLWLPFDAATVARLHKWDRWVYLTGAAIYAVAAVGATILGRISLAWVAVSVALYGAAIWCVIRAVSLVSGRDGVDDAR